MKQFLTPLFRSAVGLSLMVTVAQPVAAGLVGQNACNSWLPGVNTIVKTEKSKDCWPDCLTSVSATHDEVKVTVVDFTVADFTGSLDVAVVSNDSRLSGSQYMQTMPLTKGGNTSVSNWWKYTFTGLQPSHYYTVAIYSTDDGHGLDKPFFRSCFLTNKHPSDCPSNAYKDRGDPTEPPDSDYPDGIPRCVR